MTYKCVAVVTPPKFRVTRATAWGQLQGFIDFIKNWKTSAVSTTDGWLKLNFASCVMRQTRLLGALVLYSICITYEYSVQGTGGAAYRRPRPPR